MKAGATPNDTTSASESNSTPNWVVVLRQPRHLAVQHVEDHADEDGHRRLHVTPPSTDSTMARKPQKRLPVVSRLGSRKIASPRLLAQLLPAPSAAARRPTVRAAASRQHPHDGLAAAHPIADLDPQLACRAARSRSVREPKRISPNRSPAASLSPAAPGTRSGAPALRRSAARRHARPAPCDAHGRSARSAPTPPAGRPRAKLPADVLHARSPGPPMGARFTCTSSGDRKMDTRTAGPTHGSSTASATTITRPSAGASTAPGHRGRRPIRDPGRSPGRRGRARRTGGRRGHQPIAARDAREPRRGEDERPPLRGDRNAHARLRRGRVPTSRGGLIQDIILRSRSPTSSIGCSASRLPHGEEARAVGLVLQHPLAGELAGLDLAQDLLHLGLGLGR